MTTFQAESDPVSPPKRQPVVLSEQSIDYMVETMSISPIRHYRSDTSVAADDAISLSIPWGGALDHCSIPAPRMNDSDGMLRAPKFTVNLNQNGRDAVSSRSIYSGEGVLSKHHSLKLDAQGRFMLKLERILAQEKCIGTIAPGQLERLQARASELITERDSRYLPAYLAEAAKKHLAVDATAKSKSSSSRRPEVPLKKSSAQSNAPDLLGQLRLLRADKNAIRLPEIQLSLYSDIKNLMLKAGGVYRTADSGSFFSFPAEIDTQSVLEQLIGGKQLNVKKETQFFATPEATGLTAIGNFKRVDGLRFLEPSAGDGALADLLMTRGAIVETIENWPVNISALKAKGYAPVERDFLSVRPAEIGPFDCVLMNPPFSNRQDIFHVRHALGFLHGDGELCAIMSPQFMQSRIKDSLKFKQLIDISGAHVQTMDSGTFKDSGTQAKTVMIHIEMPKLIQALESRGETGEEYGLDLSMALEKHARAAIARP